jgi:hypothetical protein
LNDTVLSCEILANRRQSGEIHVDREGTDGRKQAKDDRTAKERRRHDDDLSENLERESRIALTRHLPRETLKKFAASGNRGPTRAQLPSLRRTNHPKIDGMPTDSWIAF